MTHQRHRQTDGWTDDMW